MKFSLNLNSFFLFHSNFFFFTFSLNSIFLSHTIIISISHPSAPTWTPGLPLRCPLIVSSTVLFSSIDLKWSRSFLVFSQSSPAGMRQRSLLITVGSVVMGIAGHLSSFGTRTPLEFCLLECISLASEYVRTGATCFQEWLLRSVF